MPSQKAATDMDIFRNRVSVCARASLEFNKFGFVICNRF